MATNTPNLNLLKKDPVADGNETFNIQTMLNENWDKIDEAIGGINFPDASLTVKGKVQLSNAIDGTREDVAATEKAVKAMSDNLTAKLVDKAPLSSPVFTGTPKVGSNPMIHAGNITSYVSPPLGYDGETTEMVIYVNAATGNDSNNGLTAATAKKTIAAAMNLMPRVSPRRRYLYMIGDFNEFVSFNGFIGGEIGILCLNNGVNTAKIKGLTFENCAVSRYHLYNFSIGDFDANNPVNGYPLRFYKCSGYANCAYINIASRVYGVTIEEGSGYYYLENIKITSPVQSAGTAFRFDKTTFAYITNCTCTSVFLYGIDAISSSVYAKTTGLSAATTVYKGGGGQVYLIT